jgi:hypothetical protein
MQDAAGGGSSGGAGSRDDSYRSIASDLASLIEHVQASMRLIESAIARETSSGNHDVAANIVVLDDVTPRYLKAGAALKACDAGLGTALHFLLDSRTPDTRPLDTRTSRHGPAGFSDRDSRLDCLIAGT